MGDYGGCTTAIARGRNIYRRPGGKLEIGYRDSTGKRRWKVAEGEITAARRTRHDPRGALKGRAGAA